MIHVGANPGFALGIDHATLLPEIERLGFDSVWTSEHILFHGPVTESLTALAYYAALAPRLKLGTAVYLMPLRHPTVTAKTAGTLDVLSGGRLILGVGVGGEYVKEFDACGVPVKQRGGRTDEGIAIVKKLWTESDVSYSGKYYQLDKVTMEPKPIQPGGPPIWVAGRSDAAIHRAARLGDGYVPYLFTADRYRSSLAKVHELAVGAGRDPSSVAAGHYMFFCLAGSKEEARQLAGDKLTKNYQQDFHPLVDRFLPLGTADDCADFVKRFVDAGARNFIMIPAVPADQVTEQILRAGEELLPLIKSLA